jgi:hypothetical protein
MSYTKRISTILAATLIAVLAGLVWLMTRPGPDGEVESVRSIAPDMIEIRGWALDARNRAQATRIFVTVNGRLAAQGEPSEVRGPYSFPTVFRIAVGHTFVQGGRSQIAAFVATKDGPRELRYSNGLAERYRDDLRAGGRQASDGTAGELGFGAEPRSDRITLLMDKSELATMAVDSAYRVRPATGTGRRSVIAGASAEGIVDGYRQAVRFGDPRAMAAAPDGETLFVIDSAAKTFRRVDVDTGLVQTVASYPPPSDFTLIAVADRTRFFAYDATRQQVVEVSGGNMSSLPAHDPAIGPLGWLAWADGRLYAIGSKQPVLTSWNGKTWATAIAFPNETAFDRFAVTGSDTVVLHSTTRGTWQPYRLSDKAPLGEAIQGPVARGIAPVGSTGRAIAYNGGAIYTVPTPAQWAQPAPLELFNVEGKPIGPTATTPAYKFPIVEEVTSLAVSMDDEDFIILDKANRRIIRLGANRWVDFDKKPTLALNSRQVIGPEYRATKPWGVNRIVWMSHSVYWDPAGDFTGNLAYSAPVRLEQMLNTDGPVRWEVLLTHLGGGSYYSDAYSRLNDILSTYGVDYVLVVVDLKNFLWFLQFAGLTIPVLVDADGIPVGVDVASNSKPISQRSYPPDVAALYEHILAAHGPNSAVPLMGPDTPGLGPFATGNFVRAWSEDAKLRTLLGNVYANLLRHLDAICRQNGARLILAMMPTNNFIATNEWLDSYRLGGAEKRYDVETMHRPFMQQLAAAGIDAIDVSYALMARQVAIFPFNGGGNHQTHLFHEAVATSLHDELLARGMISLAPQPARAPAAEKPEGLTARNKIFDYRDGRLMVLHDIWNGTDAEPPLQNVTDADFPRLLDLAMKDVETYISVRRVSPEDAKIDFVHVTAKDEYANLDFRSIRAAASMRIRIADMEAIKQMAAAGKWVDVMRLVEYQRGSRSY